MNREITTRIFLVGCPRSGTTLLQSLLAANSRIVSFPETHFYERLISGRALLAKFGISSRKARPHWRIFLMEIGHPEMESVLPKYSIFDQQYSKAFINVLDTLTLQEGKCVWLEKTPGHLRRIDQLEKLVKNVRFIHIIRNGEDNIASLFEVGNKYPESWDTWYGTLDQCIERWIIDIRLSKKYSSKDGHRSVQYEKLVADPEGVIKELCAFIGIQFEEKMLSDYSVVSKKLILGREPWKAEVHGPIWTKEKRRFYDYLDDGQRQYVRDHIPEDLIEFFSPETNGKND